MANVREREIMKDVKGWEVSSADVEVGIRINGISQVGKSVYNDARYAPVDKIIVSWEILTIDNRLARC